MASQGHSHEARDLLRDGQRSVNHDGRLSFHKTLRSCIFKKCTPSGCEAHFGEERVPGERQSRRIAENYKQLQSRVFENVCAVEARRPFGLIWRFRAVLAQTPRRPIRIRGCDHEKWVVQLFSLREFRLGSRRPVALWERAVQFQFGGLRLR